MRALAAQERQATRLRQRDVTGPKDDLDIEWEQLMEAHHQAGYGNPPQQHFRLLCLLLISLLQQVKCNLQCYTGGHIVWAPADLVFVLLPRPGCCSAPRPPTRAIVAQADLACGCFSMLVAVSMPLDVYWKLLTVSQAVASCSCEGSTPCNSEQYSSHQWQGTQAILLSCSV